MEKLPHIIKKSAFAVFELIIKVLKEKCMNLQNYDEEFMKLKMSSETYKETMIEGVKLIFEFIQARIDESPVFIHIVEQALS